MGHAFIARVQAAASQVCGSEPDNPALERKIPYRTCMKLTMNRAIASVRARLAADLYRGTRQERLAGR